ncbi:putative helicase [Gordonia amarae NBRC 15530]|uniref:Putative helicase n=1 Tax=Gordonia amarae NBRC 15530 TaxID=1075090 RepID=G7GKL3_9ACTN|nr:putative helicase [Gordonia amarae NBRC 15530]
MRIAPAELRRRFGGSALQRGTRYSNSGMVTEFGWTDRGELTGRCRGSGQEIYRVTVSFNGAPSSLTVSMATCSCPVGMFCKHAVALLLVAGRAGAVQPPPVVAWRSMLSAVLDDASGEVPTPTMRPLALSVGIEAPTSLAVRMGNPDAALLVTPMTWGKRRGWIKGGATWSDIFRIRQEDFPTAQTDAVIAIHRALAGSLFSHRDERVRLTYAPREIWDLLESARRAGVEIIAGPGVQASSVRITTARLHYGLRGCADGAQLTATVEIGDGQVLAAGDVGGVLGPAGNVHGLWGVHDDALVLAAFDPIPGAAEIAAARDGSEVLIPAADLPEFSAEVLPRLTRARTVAVHDEQLFAPPRIEGPFAVLTLTPAPAGGVRLSWSAGYTVNDTRHVFDPAETAATGFRDESAEAALWQEVRPELSATALMCRAWRTHATDHWRRRQVLDHSDKVLRELRLLQSADPDEEVIGATDIAGLLVTVDLSGVEAALLVAEALPELDRHPGIVIDNRLDVEYRAADSAPAIEFASEDSEFGNDWLSLGITVTVGGTRVPVAAVISEIVSGATHMLLNDGVYFPLDSPELRKLADLLAEGRALGEIESGMVHPASLNATFWEELLALGVVDEQLANWRDRMTALASARPPHLVDLPAELHADLRDYQHAGFEWLTFLWDNGLGGILADDMGLGKTVQTLAIITRAVAATPDARFLVVAPTSVIANWAAECHRFAPGLRVATVTATRARTGMGFEQQVAGADVVVTSYTLLRLLFDEINEYSWDGVIFDEAQFIKNHTGKTHQCARRLESGFKLAITGTPMENNLMELWSLLSVTAPGLFPSPVAFTDYFRKPIESGSAPDRLAVLRRRIKPVMLRRTKDQVAIDLPPKQEQALVLDLAARHRKIYDTRLARERQKVLGLLGDWEKNRFQVFRSLSLLRQLSLHASLVDESHHGVASSKVDYLTEQLPTLVAEGHNALVFSQFTRFLHILAAHLDKVGIAYSYLDGSMNAAGRAEAVRRFTSGETEVFLISLKAGGFGLNLTEADYCFVCDPWWNPAAEAQAVDRAHRIGQSRPVNVYRLVSAGTIEERVVALQDRKRALFDAVVDDGELFGTAISADDIREMIG